MVLTYTCLGWLQGWMEETVLFIGYYFDKTIYSGKSDDVNYNTPLAHLLSTAAYFVVILVLMVN